MSQLQPPLDEQGEAHEALASAVSNYGPRILQNPQILTNVVTDLLPDMPREQNLLIAAAEADVATDLSQHIRDRNLDPGTAVQLTAHALTGKKSIDPAASMWVTTEYARALGYDVPAYVPQSIPSPAASSYSVPSPRPSAGHSIPPSAGHSVPPSAGHSVPPPAAQWQSAPQGPSLTAQHTAPPPGYGGGATAGPWAYGPPGPGGPAMPPDNGKTNRGRLIAIASAAAAAVIIAVVALVAAGTFSSKPVPPPTPAQTTPSPSPPPTSPSPPASTADNQQLAIAIANAITQPGGRLQLGRSDGTTASQATCDPRTVSNPPDPSTPTTATCDITYSDGSVWRQTVTITYDSGGNAVSDSTNPGTQIG